ncbi:DoxX family protein [Larkinella soli]|uniref:DoxX family protein n=1 Tax=Larkinella soli TaxID=1770527 RepID=UPI000FFB5856|nr:DoxX family protein [Larkinella soli]
MKTLTVTEEHPPFPLRWIVATDNQTAPLLVRIMLAFILFPHGAQKAFGWFGGYGFEGTMGFFTDTVHLPYLLGLGIIAIELLSPFFLLLGLGTRVVSVLVGLLFIGIILTSHLEHGFFMNWDGDKPGEGFEYHLLVLTSAASLLISGAGRFSLDQRLAK